MARQKTDDQKNKICEAALRLAGKEGWKKLTLEQIAKFAKIPVKEVHTHFSNKNQLLPAIVGLIDGRVAKTAVNVNASDSPRDRLFEVMMGRFDVLQEYRDGILAILKDGRRDPAFVKSMVPAHLKTMRQIIAWARLAPKEVHVPLVTYGLLSVYYRTLWEWEKDRSQDMTKTMATLDRSLRFAAKAVDVMSRASK